MKRIGASIRIGIKVSIAITMLIALIVSIIFGMILIYYSDTLVADHFLNEKTWAAKTQKKATELQQYIDNNNLTPENADELDDWSNSKNTDIYIYDDKHVYFASRNLGLAYYEQISTGNDIELTFGDKKVKALIYYALDYKYYLISTIIIFFLSFCLYITIVLLKVQRLTNRMLKLEHEVNVLEGGDLDYEIHIKGRDEISSLGKSIDQMRIALKDNIKREEELVSSNHELITRMAHDLRTPLTPLLLYLEMISDGKYKSQEELEKFILISKSKAEKIKLMSDELFEHSLAIVEPSEHIVINNPQTVQDALSEQFSALVMTIESQGYQVISTVDWPSSKIIVDPLYIDRILENIISNMLKYADKTKPINLTISHSATKLTIKLSNGINSDISDSDPKNIGISNIKYMMKQMGGSIDVCKNKREFELSLEFPLL